MTTDTVLDALERAVAAVPDQVFLDFSGKTFSYAEIDLLSTRFAHELHRLGVSAGQTVSTVLDNNVDQVVTWLGANKAGAVWVPLNTAYRGEFLRHQLDDSQARIVITESRYLEHVCEVSAELPDLRLILCRGDAAAEVTARCAVPVEPLDAHAGDDDSAIPVTARPGDLSMLIYTSGTTGPSKGCMLSQNFICHIGRQSLQTVPPRPGDSFYTPLPLFHNAGVDVVTAALLSQTRATIAQRFSLSSFWSEIERSGATNARLMASIFPLVANAPDSPEMKRCFGQLRAVEGAPFPPQLRRVWHDRFGVEFASSWNYGQTEGLRLALHCVGEPTPPEDSCGRVADDCFEVAILDDDDNRVPDGGTGEIAFRPRKPHVMFEGYWRRPDETMKVWRNMWVHTGDLGRLENGYLFFVDRKKDYLRSRGENISSYEVERAFLRHPAVHEVAAHSVHTSATEDSLKITVVVRPDVVVTEEELCTWAIDNVPYFAVPRYIEFRDDLPRTPSNKVQKFQLRTEGLTTTTWDRDAAGIRVSRQR
ncbi:ATP-dependent acyl-CoA ligase [Amycolatopsis acidicola]|uniref:ATP-dependent acyl-CoA ligase n=1 Tax=Amycolatopsis acidicola TaxID=2596893 RepID=A0A5N0V7M4_9PSEU|nr:AMP-binding protein [Amycolatopsis acidicola]KAA9160512.1 ATP-dependent acyl-CoA ligase [Amycolatopsis acidicola]